MARRELISQSTWFSQVKPPVSAAPEITTERLVSHLSSTRRSWVVWKIFFGRKFTLDGHLLGNIGEAIAADMF